MTEYSYPDFLEAVLRHRGRECWVHGLLRARMDEVRDRFGKGGLVGMLGSDVTVRLAEFAGCDGPMDAHHLIPKQRIKGLTPSDHYVSSAEPIDVNAALMSPANGVPACRRHHDLLGRRLVVIRRHELPEDVFRFAEDVGMTWAVERDFPD